MQPMTLSPVSSYVVESSRALIRLLALPVGLFALVVISPFARAADSGAVTGAVSNTATGNMLEGARVEIPSLGVSALTDATGRYIFSNVPPGTHEVVVTYIGLDAMRGQVEVSGGRRAVRDFDLTSSIYKLEAFKVTGE